MDEPGVGLIGGDIRPLREQVYDCIRAWIIDGRLTPGNRINERVVSEELSVSRVPVREAISMLQADGLVIPSSRRGVVVRTMEQEDIDELFALRSTLERFEAELAANSRNEELKRHLSFLITESAIALEDPTTLSDLNQQIHEDISKLAGNRHLAEVLSRLAGRLRWNPSQNSDTERLLREHQDLVEAILKGDAEAASQAAALHVETRHAALLASLQSNRFRPAVV